MREGRRANDAELRRLALELALMECVSKARFELAHPTGLHATCLSLIVKIGERALLDAGYSREQVGAGTPYIEAMGD